MAPLKLCLASAEIMPYAKTGGLADVVGALMPELALRGHDVRAFMPLYGHVRRERPELEPLAGCRDIEVTIASSTYAFSLWTCPYPGTAAPVYFVDCPALFDRPSLYTFDADEHRRFLVFTRAVLASCPRLQFSPNIFHCHDWHTAFLPLLARMPGAAAPAAASRSVLTIHNIGYQGAMPAAALGDLDLGAAAALLDLGDFAAGHINALRTGIKFADEVTTVSPTYAREICDTALGMGMQRTLRERPTAVVGILNGVDYRQWDPGCDPYLDVHFSAAAPDGKETLKKRLTGRLGLEHGMRRPLLCMVSRLAEQKGIELLFDSLPALLEQRQFGLCVLGSGESRYVEFFQELERRHPGRVALRVGYDEALAHLMEAGSDLFLMPSRYEPCGLNQMYSLRYGTIPIVRRTGGLADSVRHFDPLSGTGTGCVFNDYDAPAVRWAVTTALQWYDDPATWERLRRNAMAEDFSWARQTEQYERVYRAALAAPALHIA